jgi:hypothetical protein
MGLPDVPLGAVLVAIDWECQLGQPFAARSADTIPRRSPDSAGGRNQPVSKDKHEKQSESTTHELAGRLRPIE